MTAAQEEALERLNNLLSENNFINITGPAGSGKSFLADQFISKNSDSKLILNLKNFNGEYLTDIYAFLLGQIKSDIKNSFVETYYNLARLQEIFKEFDNSSDLDPNEFIELFRVKENYHYFNYIPPQLDKFIDKYKEKEKLKFLEKLSKVAFESFVIDIYRLFSYENLDQKIEVVIVIDDNDNMLSYLDKLFIEEFLKFDKNPNFSFYDNEEITNSGIKQFIDFKLLLFSREEKDSIENKISLEYPDRNEVIELLEKLDHDNKQAEKIADLTKSNMQMIYLYANDGLEEKAKLYEENLKYLFRYFSEKEMLIISSLAYFECFEINALKLLDLDININNDFEYLKNQKAYFYPKEESLHLDNFYSELIKDTVRLNDESYHNQISQAAEIYRSITPIIDKYSSVKFELLRHLAYFKRFDSGEVLFKLFEGVHKNEILQITNTEIIEKDNYTYFIKQDYRELLLNFNRIADKSQFDTKYQVVKDLWYQQSKELKKAKDSYKKELAQITSDAQQINKELKGYESKLDELKTEIIETEQSINEIKNKQEKYNHKQSVALTLVLTLIGLVSLVSGVIGELFFDENIVYLILSSIGLILLIYNFLPLRRIIIRQKMKTEIKANLSEIEKLTQYSEELSKSSEIIKADIKASNSKSKEIEKDINNYNKDLNTIESKLKEKFID